MKNLGIFLAIGSLFVWAFGESKQMLSEHIEAIKQFTYKIRNISNLRISSGKIKFNLAIQLNNPSIKNFNFNSGNTITLSEIKFFNQQGNYLGVARPGLTSINLPANGQIEIKDIPTELPLNSVGNVFTLATNASSLSKNLKIKATIKVAGKTFKI